MIDTTYQNLNEYPLVVKMLEPARRHLVDSLVAIFRKPPLPEYRPLAASVLQNYASDLPELLADLVVEADPRSFGALYEALHSKPDAAKMMIKRLGPSSPADTSGPSDTIRPAQQANAAITLLKLGEQAHVWPLLVWTPDPLLRSEIIHRAHLYGALPDPLVKHLDAERDVTIRQALILAIGEFDSKRWPDTVRRPFIEKLFTFYREDDDPGIRGSAEWLLRNWGHEDSLERTDLAIPVTAHLTHGDGTSITKDRRWS